MCVCVCVCVCSQGWVGGWVGVCVCVCLCVNVHRKMTLGLTPNCESNLNCIIIGLI